MKINNEFEFNKNKLIGDLKYDKISISETVSKVISFFLKGNTEREL